MWNYTFPEKLDKPRYLYIADRLEDDIISGELAPRARLMTHRELAAETGVTAATINKAYREVERRGLIKMQVGRGTFVLENKCPAGNARDCRDGIIDLGATMPLQGTDPSVDPILMRIVHEGNSDALINCYMPLGLAIHRETGSNWLRQNGIDATADSVLIANGQQHALSSIISGLFRIGDRVAVAQYTNPGLKMLLQRSAIEMEGVAMDDDGMIPEHLDELCKSKKINGLFVAENTHNPSARLTSEERRKALCEVVDKHKLLLFEDGSFNWIAMGKNRPFSSLLPDSSVYYACLGPSIYSGLRVAFIHAPQKLHTGIAQAIMENLWTVSPLAVAIACEVITDGTLAKAAKNKSKEIARRIKVFRDVLAPYSLTCSEDSIYAWLFLPESQDARDFERQAEKNGVRILSADRFIVGSFSAPNCVRLSVTGPKDIPSLKRGLDILAGMLKSDSSLITPIW